MLYFCITTPQCVIGLSLLLVIFLQYPHHTRCYRSNFTQSITYYVCVLRLSRITNLLYRISHCNRSCLTLHMLRNTYLNYPHHKLLKVICNLTSMHYATSITHYVYSHYPHNTQFWVQRTLLLCLTFLIFSTAVATSVKVRVNAIGKTKSLISC